jgi:phosphatidate phosphatase APP1
MYYAETRADNSGYTNHRVTRLVVMGSPQSVDKRRQLHPAFYLSYSPFLTWNFFKKYNFSIIMIAIEMKNNNQIKHF